MRTAVWVAGLLSILNAAVADEPPAWTQSIRAEQYLLPADQFPRPATLARSQVQIERHWYVLPEPGGSLTNDCVVLSWWFSDPNGGAGSGWIELRVFEDSEHARWGWCDAIGGSSRHSRRIFHDRSKPLPERWQALMVGRYHVGWGGDWIDFVGPYATTLCARLRDAEAAAPRRPLCREAEIVFPSSAAKIGRATGLLIDRHDLAVQFEGAVDSYNQAHGTHAAFVTENLGGTIPALLWLFSSGGTTTSGELDVFGKTVKIPGLGPASQYSAQSFVFLPAGRAEEARRRGFVPPFGSEPALAEAIRKAAVDGHRKLNPGDVLRLALEQREGDMREALLLAHNTLRSLARAGDAGVTGVDRQTAYYDDYLTTLRDGDNAGPWYHLFGTAYFELQSKGDYVAPLWPAEDTISAIDLLLRGVDQLLGRDPEQDKSGCQALTSELANLAEQFYREALGGEQPDPEKYCFNVWGAQVAAWLRQSKLRREGIDWRAPTQTYQDFIQAVGSKACQTTADFWNRLRSAEPTDPTLRRLLGYDVHILGSPVDAVWSAEGQRLQLDQLRSTLSGQLSAIVIPTVDPATGTWRVVWLAPRDLACQVDLSAIADGPVHLVTIRLGEGSAFRHEVTLHQGERMSAELGGEAPPRVRKGNGQAVSPTVIEYLPDATLPATPNAPGPAPVDAGVWRGVFTSPQSSVAGPTEIPPSGVMSLFVRVDQPGTLLDSVGVNAAPKGAYTLSVTDERKVRWQVFDPTLNTRGAVGNGWHILESSPIALGTEHEIIITYGESGTVMAVGDDWKLLIELNTSLQGAAFLGDFPGDAHWAPPVRTERGFIGEIRQFTANAAD